MAVVHTILLTISNNSFLACATPSGLPSIRIILLCSASDGILINTPVSFLILVTKINKTNHPLLLLVMPSVYLNSFLAYLINKISLMSESVLRQKAYH